MSVVCYDRCTGMFCDRKRDQAINLSAVSYGSFPISLGYMFYTIPKLKDIALATIEPLFDHVDTRVNFK